MARVTEEEAQTMWCPFARVKLCDGASANRVEDNDFPHDIKGAQCIGSACMAWRTDGSITKHHSVRRGYCGLVGTPK